MSTKHTYSNHKYIFLIHAASNLTDQILTIIYSNYQYILLILADH